MFPLKMEQVMQSFGAHGEHTPSRERVMEMARGRFGCSEYLEGLHIFGYEISCCPFSLTWVFVVTYCVSF